MDKGLLIPLEKNVNESPVTPWGIGILGPLTTVRILVTQEETHLWLPHSLVYFRMESGGLQAKRDYSKPAPLRLPCPPLAQCQ